METRRDRGHGPGRAEQTAQQNLQTAGCTTRVEVGFSLCWWDIPDRTEQATIVEPVHPFEGSELDILEASPRPPLSDHLRFVEADDRLGESIVVAVADASDGGRDPGLGEALAVFDRDVLDALGAMQRAL